MRTRCLGATALASCLAFAYPAGASAPQAGAPAAPAPAGPVQHLTAEQWREDLRFMAAEMKQRHRNLYHTVSREAFEAAVADLHDRIPRLQRNEIIVGMMRIAAMVGDGHTRIDPRKDPRFGFPSLPLKLYLFEDGLFVRAAAPQHAALIGARIEAIGGVPVDEAIRRVSEIASRDNASGQKKFVPLYLNMPDVLHALGMSDSRGAAVLKLSRSGRTWTAKVLAGEVEPLWPPDTDVSLVTPPGWADACKASQPPLWLQAPLEYHRLIELPDRRALYIQLNMIDSFKGQTLPQFAEKIGDKVKATNPRALILDVRLAHGGNGGLRTPLVRELIKAEDSDTRLFVLTWRGAYSASQFVLDDLDRLTDAVFIGEPASSKPSSYGDSYRMPMPNSGISVRSSIVYWQEEQNMDPWTWVDIATPYAFADYAACRDPALEAALAYSPEPSLQDQVKQAAANGGLDAVRKVVETYRSDPRKRYANQPLDLVRAAGALFRAKHHDEAILVAELATQQFPDSLITVGTLAELAEAAGRKDLARKAGSRALEIDRNNRFIRSLMERLSAPPPSQPGR